MFVRFKNEVRSEREEEQSVINNLKCLLGSTAINSKQIP